MDPNAVKLHDLLYQCMREHFRVLGVSDVPYVATGGQYKDTELGPCGVFFADEERNPPLPLPSVLRLLSSCPNAKHPISHAYLEAIRPTLRLIHMEAPPPSRTTTLGGRPPPSARAAGSGGGRERCESCRARKYEEEEEAPKEDEA